MQWSNQYMIALPRSSSIHYIMQVAISEAYLDALAMQAVFMPHLTFPNFMK